MKLKGLVWFFAIILVIISLWELSYTWVIHNFESEQETKATKYVKNNFPQLKGLDQTAAIELRKDKLLDSLKEKEIYPVIGTTYKKCKDNELHLGLDLQGGMSVTLDVSLEGLLKSLSVNPKDPQLLKAIQTASDQHAITNADFIGLFQTAYTTQNPGANLAGTFARPNSDIKTTDDNATVINKIRIVASTAIKQTYRILKDRIDRFGLTQPNINLDESKNIISVELAGVKDPERIKGLLQASANLQFWEVFTMSDNELANGINNADKALKVVVNGVDSTNKDSTTILGRLIGFYPPGKAEDGSTAYGAMLGRVYLNDTSELNKYLNMDVVKNSLPPNCKLLYGKSEKDDATKGKKRGDYLPLYAIKTSLNSPDKAPVNGSDVESARQDYDPNGGPAVSMQMNSTGTKRWATLSKKNLKKPIAIVLDDIVYSAPTIQGEMNTGDCQISGHFSIEEAQDLANVLTSGKLDAPAKIVADQVVGPTLGAEAVKGGLMAFGIAFAIIFILMLVYYNTGGWVANIALILNLLFTIGVLTAWGFTLTAAGIAGLVLTIGMAVDTNVIIFERIKEELTKGKSYPQAVNDGYKRSLAPVLDAHVTTFLTAAILFFFGLGPVLGFATTQMLGIVLSLFCGILVSRLITDTWTKKNRHFNYFTGISKRVFKHAAYKFIEYRKVAYGISVLVLLLGVGAFFNGFRLGVEFEGGRSYTVKFNQAVSPDKVRDDLNASFKDNTVIKTVGYDQKSLDITTSYLKGVNNADSAVKTKLFEGLKKVLPAGLTYDDFIKQKYIQQYTTVQPSISEELKAGAVKATIFALLMIFVYIFIRFRDWRYSVGTIIALLHDVLVTLAVFSFFKNIVPFPLEIDQHFIAAVLTVIGFSMNDTVIVFDRVREYSGTMKGADKGTVINKAINDTLSRTIMTSLTVFLTLLVLFIFGGEVTRGFAFAMLIGVITGTYSSIFVAAPILVDFAKSKPLGTADLLNHDKKPVVKKP
ncbi:MAG: protein translocase subunit SecD [Ferruginibacter sp.]